MPRAPVGRTAILHATVGQPKSPSSKQLLLAVGRRKDQNPQIFFKETGFRVQGLGFRVQGLGFRESPTRKLKSHKTWSCRKPNGFRLGDTCTFHAMPRKKSTRIPGTGKFRLSFQIVPLPSSSFEGFSDYLTCNSGSSLCIHASFSYVLGLCICHPFGVLAL